VSFKRRHDADLRIASARRLVQILLESTDLYPAHRREFLKLALWKVTEAEPELEGWTRYHAANIEIVDMATEGVACFTD
jgi:hypothetical protein